MGKKEDFEQIITILNAQGEFTLSDVMRHELELTIKKNAPKPKSAKKIKEEQDIENTIINCFSDGVEELNLNEITIKLFPAYSRNQVIYHLRKLAKDGKVIATKYDDGSVYCLP